MPDVLPGRIRRLQQHVSLGGAVLKHGQQLDHQKAGLRGAEGIDNGQIKIGVFLQYIGLSRIGGLKVPAIPVEKQRYITLSRFLA